MYQKEDASKRYEGRMKMTRDEFTQKVLELEDVLFHISYGILQNEADCEDAVQEAILKAYAGKEKLKKPQYFKTWLVRIVLNECYSFLRKRRRELPLNEALTEITKMADIYVKEEYLELYESLKQLTEKDRICVQLCYLEGYSVKEIAQIFRIPEGTVKSRLNRARKQLKSNLIE